jgi:hypothetical protein
MNYLKLKEWQICKEVNFLRLQTNDIDVSVAFLHDCGTQTYET